MKNKKVSYLLLAVVLLTGIAFFGCEQFGTGGDVSSILYGKWKLDNENLPDGVNLTVSFGVSGNFDLAASADVDKLLELIGDGSLIDTRVECPECYGSGIDYWRGEECYYCDGTGYVESDSSIFDFLNEIDIAEFINVKTLTLEIRGTYSDDGTSITLTPTGIKSNVFGLTTSALKKVYGQYLNEILDMLAGSSDINVLIRGLLDLINVNDILFEVDKNFSGWVGTPQIKNILNYSYDKVNTLFKNKLVQLGLTEDDLADYFGENDEEEYPIIQSLSELNINEQDLMIISALYYVKLMLNEVKDNINERIDSMLAEIISPIGYELESGILALYGMVFTR